MRPPLPFYKPVMACMSKYLNVIAGSLTGKLLLKVFSPALLLELIILCLLLCLFSGKTFPFFATPRKVASSFLKTYHRVCYIFNLQLCLELKSQ